MEGEGGRYNIPYGGLGVGGGGELYLGEIERERERERGREGGRESVCVCVYEI